MAIKTLSSVKLMAIEFRFILIMMEAIVFIIVVYSFREWAEGTLGDYSYQS